MNPPEWLPVGRVLSVDAARRGLRIQLKRDCGHELDGRDRLWIGGDRPDPLLARVESCRNSGTVKYVTLTPGVSRDDMVAFTGAEIFIPADARNPRPAGHVLESLKGMQVLAPGNRLLGTVFETVATPAGGVIRLITVDARTAALPAIPEVIVAVDPENRTVSIVDPLPYLVVDDEIADE